MSSKSEKLLRERERLKRAIVTVAKASREDADLTRHALAERLGRTYSQIVNMEHGAPRHLLLAILSVMIVAAIAKVVMERIGDHFFLQRRRKRLKVLTAEERAVLRAYIEGQTRTRYLDIASGVAKGLVQEQIIYRSSNVGSAMYGGASFAHNIQPWAWEYLNEHRELLSDQAGSNE